MWSRLKIAALCLGAFVSGTGLQARLAVGDKFPPLDAFTFAGGIPPDTTGKVTLVDFWASWCAPCKASFPTYAQLHADCQARGLVVVAVSVDENQAAFEAFVRQLKPPFATVRDQDRRLVSRVNVPAMPTCFLLDRDGRVRFVHQGFHGADTALEIRREIDTLLAENPPSS
jgi:thiol-disulfide isomerase/thioredoxin